VRWLGLRWPGLALRRSGGCRVVHRSVRLLAGAAICVGAAACTAPAESTGRVGQDVPGVLDFTPAERRAILSHGPWPALPDPDTSNRLERDPRAVAIGARLFHEPRLSGNGQVSCATCHRPDRAFQDGRSTAIGLGPGVRNTLSLLDTAGQRWFGWDGGSDSLWAASVRPLLNPAEMGATAAGVAAFVRGDPSLSTFFDPALGDEALLADVGKALAAWQATLVSPRTRFDDFRDALSQGDVRQAARATAYPLAAQRGLRLFVGAGRCHLCHAGPRFSNGEFADIGAAFFVPGGVDPGRHGGLRRLQSSPHNRLGLHADDGGAGAVATRHLRLEHRHFGEFKVPGLRGLRQTGPYFHDGSRATLADVVRHYDQLDEDRLHADGERILVPLRLSPQAAADLLAFLETLSEPAALPAR
jgi:cytochrome c peroxidase